jgi:hypothetical protein
MAPKGRAAKALAKDKKTAVPKAPPLSAALLDKDEHAESVAQKSARKRIRNIDDAVSKALIDNFRGWTMEKFDLEIRNGKSLRDQVRFDKEQQPTTGLTMGKNYYASLRVIYEDDMCPA